MTTYLLLFLWCLGAPEAPLPHSGGEGLSAEALRTELVRTLNNLRARGCRCGPDFFSPAPPLAWNDRLAASARRHAADMAGNDHFGHTGTDGSTSGRRAAEAGYDWRSIAENIAGGLEDIGEVMAAWQNSPDHCRNMLDPELREVGAANEEEYWVMTLGRR